MKRYNVKDVVRLEKRLDRLETSNEALEDLSMPLFLLTCIGGVTLTTGIVQGSSSVIPLIYSGVCSLIGGTKLVNMITAEARGDKLRQKIFDIYDTMGSDFKKEVSSEINKKSGMTR